MLLSQCNAEKSFSAPVHHVITWFGHYESYQYFDLKKIRCSKETFNRTKKIDKDHVICKNCLVKVNYMSKTMNIELLIEKAITSVNLQL